MGLSVVMQRADLRRTVITILEDPDKSIRGSVNIINSTFSQMTVMGKFDIRISDCQLQSNLFNTTSPKMGFHLQITYSVLNIQRSDVLLYYCDGFLRGKWSVVSFENVRFSKGVAGYVTWVSDGSEVHMKNVLFKNLDCISLQRIYININSSGIINDCSFINFYGTVAVAQNADVLISKTYFGDFRPGSFLYLRDSTVSMTIENSNLNNVTVDTIGGHVNATRCTFTMVGTKDIFSLQVDSNIYAADNEFIGGVVLFSLSGVQGHFNNCTPMWFKHTIAWFQ